MPPSFYRSIFPAPPPARPRIGRRPTRSLSRGARGAAGAGCTSLCRSTYTTSSSSRGALYTPHHAAAVHTSPRSSFPHLSLLDTAARPRRWMSILYSVIARAVPPPALAPLHGDRAQLAAMPFWKGKRVAAKVMNRVFQTCAPARAPAPPAPATAPPGVLWQARVRATACGAEAGARAGTATPRWWRCTWASRRTSRRSRYAAQPPFQHALHPFMAPSASIYSAHTMLRIEETLILPPHRRRCRSSSTTRSPRASCSSSCRCAPPRALAPCHAARGRRQRGHVKRLWWSGV